MLDAQETAALAAGDGDGSVYDGVCGGGGGGFLQTSGGVMQMAERGSDFVSNRTSFVLFSFSQVT